MRRFELLPSAGVAVLAMACVVALRTTSAQQPGPTGPTQPRKATTTHALAAHPVFFHGMPVRVRGHIEGGAESGPTRLVYEQRSVLLTGAAIAGQAPGPDTMEIIGTFVDVGRLDPSDPRLAGIDLQRLWPESGSARTWPAQGELQVLIVEAIERAESFVAPSLRALALNPFRYEGQPVTVTGRFRGRNLFADQPTAPGRSRWDFVLQSAEASVWVVGQRPRGRGFSLDVDTRVDTSHWLEAQGTVRVERGLVLIEARELALAKPEDRLSQPVALVPTVGPRPEVVFSVPTQGETEVDAAQPVRIQFSRDMAPASFTGRVRAIYEASPSEASGAPALPIPVSTKYVAGIRTLEVNFGVPIDRFRTVVISLGEEITATDGVALVPYELKFQIGGR